MVQVCKGNIGITDVRPTNFTVAVLLVIKVAACCCIIRLHKYVVYQGCGHVVVVKLSQMRMWRIPNLTL